MSKKDRIKELLREMERNNPKDPFRVIVEVDDLDSYLSSCSCKVIKVLRPLNLVTVELTPRIASKELNNGHIKNFQKDWYCHQL